MNKTVPTSVIENEIQIPSTLQKYPKRYAKIIGRIKSSRIAIILANL